MPHVLGTMVCQTCGAEFVLESEADREDFGRRLDSHVQEHHGALLAVVRDPVDEDSAGDQ